MENRLAVDIYRGILLEVVSRLISDLQTKFVDVASKSSTDLLAVHANLIFILSEFLPIIEET
jgi:hypothetical protein